jgi:predicted secreted protein
MPPCPHRRRLVVALAAPMALAVVACSGEEATSPDSTLGPGTTVALEEATGAGALDYPAYRDASAPIHVALGRRFALQLDSEPGAGYSWQVSNRPDPAVVVPLGTQLRSTNPGVPGSSAVQYISFAASGLGTTTIDVEYVSPNGEPAPDAEPIQFTVTVTFTGDPPPPPDDSATTTIED